MIKILVVDDEENIREVLFRSLLAEGYDCITAKNGYDAIRIFPVFNPEILITGYRTPGMDGMDLMKFVHHHYPKIRVMLLSRHGELEIAIDAVALGVYAIFRKPLDLDEILAVLGRISKEMKQEFGKLQQRGDWIKEYAKLKKSFGPPLLQREKLTGANNDRFNG